MTNLISWVEIPAENFNRAVKFYNAVLKTELQIIEGDDEKMACFPSGEGAISYAPGFKPSQNGALVSFNTEKGLDQAIEKVLENGGTIVQSKTKIEAEGRGYFALFIDSEGNKAGLYGDE